MKAIAEKETTTQEKLKAPFEVGDFEKVASTLDWEMSHYWGMRSRGRDAYALHHKIVDFLKIQFHPTTQRTELSLGVSYPDVKSFKLDSIVLDPANKTVKFVYPDHVVTIGQQTIEVNQENGFRTTLDFTDAIDKAVTNPA